MKKIALIICFCIYAHIFAQVSKDSLYTLEGKAFAGEYVRIDQKSIYFKIEGSANTSTLPKDKIDKVFLKSGEAVNIITGKIINLKENKRLEEEKRKKCEFNQKERIIVFPFKEDKIARAQDYVQSFKSDCYTVISNYDAYKFFDKNDISYNNLSDYDIINMSTALNINRVYLGELYIINQPFKQPIFYNESLLKGGLEIWKKQQAIAEKKAGSFLYETVYYIDTISRERVYIKTDNFIKKW